MAVALLLFAAFGFAGAGAAYAVGRLHELEDGDPDVSMRGLAFVLALFSGICTFAATGLLGILAYGGVICWCSYVFCAQRIGVFSIQSGRRAPRVETVYRDGY